MKKVDNIMGCVLKTNQTHFLSKFIPINILYVSDSQPGVHVSPGVRTRTFRGTREKKIEKWREKGTYVDSYSLQLQHINLK